MDQRHIINNFNNPTLLRMLPQTLTPLHQPIQLSKLLFKIQPLLSKIKKKLLKIFQKKIKVNQKSQKIHKITWRTMVKWSQHKAKLNWTNNKQKLTRNLMPKFTPEKNPKKLLISKKPKEKLWWCKNKLFKSNKKLIKKWDTCSKENEILWKTKI